MPVNWFYRGVVNKTAEESIECTINGFIWVVLLMKLVRKSVEIMGVYVDPNT